MSSARAETAPPPVGRDTANRHALRRAGGGGGQAQRPARALLRSADLAGEPVRSRRRAARPAPRASRNSCPATAAGRGLADPFEPARALDESAAYLRELRQQFGNLGLAAAAYNAGPGRVGRWLAGTAGLPAETIGYVEIVTGHAAFEWRGTPPPVLTPEPGFSCGAFAGDAGRRRAPATIEDPTLPPPKAWAVILVASFNRVALTAEYAATRAKLAKVFGDKGVEPERPAKAPATGGPDAADRQPAGPPVPLVRRRHLGGEPAKKYVVQIETNDRASSNRICKRLEAAGGNCVVLRNLLR